MESEKNKQTEQEERFIDNLACAIGLIAEDLAKNEQKKDEDK